MSQPPTRKTFLAQLLGTFAVVGLAPKLPAKLAASAVAPVSPHQPFAIQPEVRAVARQG